MASDNSNSSNSPNSESSSSGSRSDSTTRGRPKHDLDAMFKKLKADLQSNYDSILKDIREVSQRVTTLEKQEQSSLIDASITPSASVQSDLRSSVFLNERKPNGSGPE